METIENSDLEQVLNDLADATLGMTELKNNFVNINEIEDKISGKIKESQELYEKTAESAQNVKSQSLQAQAILDEIKEIKNDFDKKFKIIEEKENKLIKLLENYKNMPSAGVSTGASVSASTNADVSTDANANGQNQAQPSLKKPVVLKVKKIPSADSIEKETPYIWENKKIENGLTRFVINKHFGTLSKGSMNKEFNLISWNDGPAVYDIRSFNQQHNNPSEGLTFSQAVLNELKIIMNSFEIEELKELSDYKNIVRKDETTKYTILKNIGNINFSSDIEYQLNIMSWNGKPAVYDFRKWIKSNNFAKQGMEFSYSELLKLKKIFNNKL